MGLPSAGTLSVVRGAEMLLRASEPGKRLGPLAARGGRARQSAGLEALDYAGSHTRSCNSRR
jgi:hypothetical protein